MEVSGLRIAVRRVWERYPLALLGIVIVALVVGALVISDEGGAIMPVLIVLAFIGAAMWQVNQSKKGPDARFLRAVEAKLSQLTSSWSEPLLVRAYESGPPGEERFQIEAKILASHGYRPTTQGAEGSHLHAGRLLLTGGLSVFAGRGGIRSKGRLTVTYQKESARTDLADELRKLAGLRDEGILTEDEFQAKKRQLLV